MVVAEGSRPCRRSRCFVSSSSFVSFRFALLLFSFNFLSFGFYFGYGLGVLSVSAWYSGRRSHVAAKQGNAGLKPWGGAIQRRRRGRTGRTISTLMVLFVLRMERTWRCCQRFFSLPPLPHAADLISWLLTP